jgi:hypothetical protein
MPHVIVKLQSGRGYSIPDISVTCRLSRVAMSASSVSGAREGGWNVKRSSAM